VCFTVVWGKACQKLHKPRACSIFGAKIGQTFATVSAQACQILTTFFDIFSSEHLVKNWRKGRTGLQATSADRQAAEPNHSGISQPIIS